MKIIFHRRNTITDLNATNRNYGVEVDIRSFGDRLIIQHDPYVSGECFETWLKAYKHGTLILNVKEEGLEERLVKLMESVEISDFFFLDQSFPFLVKLSSMGETRCAVRVSEYESIDTALSLKGKVDWVWVDCFNKFSLSTVEFKILKRASFKLCLVSPELQGREAKIEIPRMANLIKERNISLDAVCTKNPDIWQKMIT